MLLENLNLKKNTDRLRILLVTYDNDSYTTWFPQGLAAVAAVLKQEGHDVHVWDQDVNHYPDEALTEFLNKNHFDILGISVIAGYWQYRKLLGLSKAIAASKNRPGLYVIGGYGPTPEPKYFLEKTQADVVVMGEGEDTTRELFQKYAAGESYKDITGIAYREGDTVTINPPRPLIPENLLDNIDRVPMPAYDLFEMDVYRLYHSKRCRKTDFTMPVLSGRGCTFKCNFCYRMDKGFRPRSPEGILDEVEYLQTNYGINYIMFSDDLLMVSKDRTMALSEAFIKHQEKTGRKFKWNCNGRLNYCTPEILQTMERAGCVFINYGIEAFDNDILKVMKKGLNCKTIVKGVEETLKTSISPGLNLIWGNIGETKETLQKAVDFLIKYDDHSQLRTIRPTTPYPGSPLYHYAIDKGLLDKDNPAEDFYERKHLNSDLLAVNFTDLSDHEYHAALATGNKQLIDNFFEHQVSRYHRQTDKLYYGNDVAFRGYRQGSNTGGQEKITMTDEDDVLKLKKAKAEAISSGDLLADVGQAGEDSLRGDGRSLGVGGSY